MDWSVPSLLRSARVNAKYFFAVLAFTAGLFAYFDFDAGLYEKNEVLPRMHASEGWPQTDGVVLGARMEEGVSGRFSHMPVTHYYAEVRYAYEVAGEGYEHWRICFDTANCNTGTDREDAEAMLERYAPGTPVRVAYNSADPTDAVLRPGLRSWAVPEMRRHFRNAWLAVAAAVVCIVLAVYCCRRWPDPDTE